MKSFLIVFSVLAVAAKLSVAYVQPPPGYQMPAFPTPPPPTSHRRPLTSQEITAIDMKLATMREAFGIILDLRRNNPHSAVLQLPDVQRLYRMILPIVKAAERVEAQSHGMGVLDYINPRGPIGTMGFPQQGSPLVAPPQQPVNQPYYSPLQMPPYPLPNSDPDQHPTDFPPESFDDGYMH